MISLSDLSDSQYGAVTGRRRRINLGDITRFQLPAYIASGRNRALEDLDEARFEESRRQFSDKLALDRITAEEAEKQGKISTGISGATAIGQGLYGAKRLGWLKSGDKGVSGIEKLPSMLKGGTTGVEETASVLGYDAAPTSLSEITAAETVPGIVAPEGGQSLAAISAGTAGPTAATAAPSLAVASEGFAGAGASAGLVPVEVAGPSVAGYAAGPIAGAGIGYGVGRMTQSRTKGAVAGTISGVGIGFAAGGPIGAIVGGAAGLVSGLVGGNK